MSKNKKKTRKQKMLADLHRKLYSLKSQNIIVLQEEQSVKAQEPQIKIATAPINKPVTQSVINTYPYLLQDISKTGILTVSILVLQFIVFFLLKNRLLTLPGINY